MPCAAVQGRYRTTYGLQHSQALGMVLNKDEHALGPLLIQEGDLVIVYESYASIKSLHVDPKAHFSNRFGNFAQKDWVGKPFGSKVYCKGPGRGWVHLLAPTPELWTLVLRHRTQILYVADISLVVLHLELHPGSCVLESGTGSGSLTHSLARAVAPTGHVHTFEFHAVRAEEARKEFEAHGLGALVSVAVRNIEEQGFPEALEGAADGLFLDLPGPWKAVPSAARCLKPDGRFCAFSPCIEQVQRTVEALDGSCFTDITTLEVLLRNYEVFDHTFTTDIPGPAVHGGASSGGSGSKERPRKRPREEPTEAAAAAAEHGGEGTEAAAAAAGTASEREAADEDEGAAPAERVPPLAVAAAAVSEQQQAAADTGPALASGAAVPAPVPSQQPSGQQQQQQAGRSCGGGEVKAVVTRPSVEALGHTGYLTFARKFVSLPSASSGGQ